MKSPNLVMVVIDAARVDRFSCFGYERETTPFLDQLSSERATRFSRAYSPAPWTVPAFASLFTGLYPSRHGATRSHPFLDCPNPTLAEALARRGYQTFGVSNSSWVSTATQYDRGFESFFKVWQLIQDRVDPANAHLQNSFSKERRRSPLSILRGGSLVRNVLNTIYGRTVYKRGDYGAKRVNRTVDRWLSERDRARPFFGFVYYLEPHIHYRPPERLARKFLPDGVTYREALKVNQDAWAYMSGSVEMTPDEFEILGGLYDAEIAYTDERLKDLFGHLKDSGALDNTIVAITADHGENLGEHGMMDHQYCLYEPLLRVPLLVHAPDRFPPGQVIDKVVQSFDLFPTFLKAADPQASELDAIDAESFLPEDLEERQRDYAIAEYPEPQPRIEVLERDYPGCEVRQWDRSLRAIRTEQWKLVEGSDGRVELYEISQDPGELEDLSELQPEVVASLREILERELGPLQEPGNRSGVSLGPEMEQRLKALGYIS